jgi:hypothetical protein
MGKLVNSLLFVLHLGQILSFGILFLSKYVAHQKHVSHRMNIGGTEGNDDLAWDSYLAKVSPFSITTKDDHKMLILDISKCHSIDPIILY